MGINEDIGRSVVWKVVYLKGDGSDSEVIQEVIQKIVSNYVIVNLIANYSFFYNFLMYGNSFYLHIRMNIQ